MNKRSINIGRDVENDIVYSDQTVSRKHASITQVSDDLFVVQDLSSSNGTFVNGQKIESEQRIRSSDVVAFGKQVLDWQDVQSIHIKGTKSQRPQSQSNVNSIRKYIWIPLVSLVLLTSLFLMNYEWQQKNEVEIPLENEVTNNSSDSSRSSDNAHERQSSTVDQNTTHEHADGVSNANTKTTIPDLTPRYRKKNNPIIYSIACLRSKSDLNKMIGFGADMEHGWITFSSDEVGVEEEIEVGKKLKEHVEKEHRYTTDVKMKQRVQLIFDKLLAAMTSPKMPYQLFVIESKEINAFTAGGLVFITSGIINFAENDDELACVLAHEIFHNELGHINLMMRKEKAARHWMGDFADWGLVASKILGASFNQENEVYCDMYGVDLAIKAGYDGKAAVDFWKRMKSQGKGLDKIFSTHPFSNERMNCVHEHIERNYE